MTTTSACCDTCASPTQDATLAIACTLGAGDFKERFAGIRALANRSLSSSRRRPLQLDLTYGPEALAEVEELVAKESDCCSSLTSTCATMPTLSGSRSPRPWRHWLRPTSSSPTLLRNSRGRQHEHHP